MTAKAKTNRGAVLRRCLKLINLLLEEPRTIKQLSALSGIEMRGTYRYVGVIGEVLDYRLIRTDRQPRKYWIER